MSELYVILFAVFIFFLIPAAAGSAMDSPYLFNISINSTENVSFANHNESPTEGNWIKLSGGTPITLPALNLVFNGVNSSNFTHNGKTINITTSVDNYSDYLIEYPYSSHSIYTNVSGSNEVNLSFFGSSHFADLSIDIYLANSTIDEVWNIFNDAIDGNTTLIRNLLNDSEERLNYSLNGTGDNSSISFGAQQAGDYIILVLLNSSHTNANELSILSATAVQILKYESVVTAPSSAITNHIVPVQIELTDANQNYTYGAILIHKDAYEATLRFEFNGTGKQTNLTIDGADLVEKGELTGINLSTLNTTKLQEIIETVIGPKNGTVAFTDNTDSTSASFSLTTNDLNTGDYYLLVGAYESGEKLVAFDQSIINIYTPSDSSNGGGGGGGGGASGEAFENIVCTETDRQFVGKDLNVKYNFRLEGNYVQHIEFTGLTSAGKVAAKVEILNHTSTTVDKDAPNIVFKNLNVWIGNMGYFSKNNVKDPTITFIVDRSWVSDNNIILNTISFYNHNDDTDSWEKMPTQKIGEDSTSYQFKASLPIRGSLGPMAISGKDLVYVPTPVPTPIPTPTPVITPTENILEIISNATHVTTWTEIWKTKVPGFQALTAIIALITLYIIRSRRD